MFFDFAVLGEVVEHINDPVMFLTKIKKNLRDNVEKIIITVPSALRFSVSPDILPKKIKYECINTDHRYWYTPYTIAKVCVEAGIYPEELLFCDPPRTIVNRIAKRLHLSFCFQRNSVFSDTLLLIGSLNKED